MVSNIAPKIMADDVRSLVQGRRRKRRGNGSLHVFPLCQAVFLETNPIPIKTALAMMGKVSEDMRLPLCPMAEGNRKKLQAVLKQYGLI